MPRTAWDPGRLPAHLRVTFRVEDEDGAPLAQGDDLARLRADLRPRLRARLAAASPGLERSGLRDWTIGTLPREVALAGALRAYPALVDEGDGVAVRLLDTPEAQAAAMRAGTLRLLALAVPSPLRWVQDRLDMKAQLSVAAAPHGSVRAFLEDAMAAAIEVLMDQAGGPVWDEAGWRRLRDHVAGNLAAGTRGVAGRAIAVLDRAREVELALDELSAPQFADARHDVRVQLRRLVRPGFIAAAGVRRLPDLERYLRGALRRLERLPAAPGVDADRMRTVRELEASYRRLLDGRPPGRPLPEPLRELPWLLEELRVSQFAQALGTRGGPVSVKRVRRALDEAAAAVG